MTFEDLALWITFLQRDPWGPDFLWHYFHGHSEPITLSREQVKSISAEPEIIRVMDFASVGAAIAGHYSTYITEDKRGYTVKDTGPGNIVLGDFTIILSGDFCYEKPTRKWYFVGDFRLDDTFNFNPHWFRKDSNRGRRAEIKVLLMRYLTRGIGFPVRSEQIWVYESLDTVGAIW